MKNRGFYAHNRGRYFVQQGGGGSASVPFSFTDPTFNNGDVRAIVGDGAGGKYVGGDFTSVTCNVTGITRTTGYTRLIHLLPSGEVDAAWSCPAGGTVRALAFDAASDRLYVGGFFTGATGLGGAARDYLGAVTASSGVVVSGWVCNAQSTVLALALDAASDRLYVGGNFSGATGLGGAALNRLGAVTASTGVVVAGWVCNAQAEVYALAFDAASDRLYVGGSFSGATGLGGQPRTCLGAVTASSGVVVSGWVCNASSGSSVLALALDAANDRLYVGGDFSGATGLGGQPRTCLGAVTASSGVVVSGWVCNAQSTVLALALDAASDRLYVGGSFQGATGLGGAARNRLGAVTASSGVVVSGWVCDAVGGTVRALALDAARDILSVGGFFNGATGLDGAARDRYGTVVASTGDLHIP